MKSILTRRERRTRFAVLAWWFLTVIAVAISRSLWGDEWLRVKDLVTSGVLGSMRHVLGESSPFNPGEVLPNGLAWGLGTLLHAPVELWARAQGIAWSAAVVALALRRDRLARTRAFGAVGFLTPLVFFSAPLISYATEMRPYASLFCAGALAWTCVRERGLAKSRGLDLLAWALLLFGHIYGICFVLFALVLAGQVRREIPKLVFGSALLAFVLLKGGHLPSQGGPHVYPFGELARQTLGALSNPHKAALITLPAFLLGAVTLARRDRRLLLGSAALLVATVAGPIAATISAHYFFVPRQIAAGSFAFLALAAEGFDALAARRPMVPLRNLAAALVLSASALPWMLSTVLKIPPFPNQPMHHYRELARETVGENTAGRWKTMLFVEMCNAGPMRDYLAQAFGAKAGPELFGELDGMTLGHSCYPSGFCLYWPHDFSYCGLGPEAFATGGKAARLVNDARWDVVAHELTLPFPPLTSQAALRRTW